MLKLGGKVSGIDDGIIIAREKLKDGSVYKKFLEIVEIQNGDIKYINDWKDLKRAKYSKAVKADISGYVSKINAYKFGLASIELGCGRKKVSDKIDYLAGIILNKKSGNRVEKGDILYTLFAEDEAKILHAEKHLNKAFDITNKASENRKLILDIIY